MIPGIRRVGATANRKPTAWHRTVPSLLAGSRELAGEVGLRPSRRVPLWNGPIERRVLQIDVNPRPVEGRGPGWR